MGSSTLLILLPKCPMCIAASLTLWTGAGVAMSVAMHLCPMLEMLFIAWRSCWSYGLGDTDALRNLHGKGLYAQAKITDPQSQDPPSIFS